MEKGVIKIKISLLNLRKKIKRQEKKVLSRKNKCKSHN